MAGEFGFDASFSISAAEELRPEAEYAAAHFGCPVNYHASRDNCLALVLSAAEGFPDEGFRLEVDEHHILIKAAHRGGIFNGLQALFRLLPAQIYRKGEGVAGCRIPCCVFEDAPRYPYRGVMLDVARTWMDYDSLIRYVDLLAYHGINKLHLHLTDDEGWRIEILSHPELALEGGFRGGDAKNVAVYGMWDKRYGGYYTQEQLRALVAYAAVRNIEIIPEIDLPGHSRAIASVYPEIRCNYAPDLKATVGYDYRSAWCVAREENYLLLEDILKEVCALFPSEYVHVGGDEVEVSQWRRCPDCNRYMRSHGIQDVHRLQQVFMKRVEEILSKYGKTSAVWNEAVKHASLDGKTRVYGWENLKEARAVAAKGYPTVVMPAERFYLDMRQGKHEEGHSWAGVFDARDLFGFDLEKSGFTPSERSRVLGFECPFWSETYLSHRPESSQYIDYMCFPRIAAMARLAWNGNGEGWERYYRELKTVHYDRMSAMGILFRLFPPKLNDSEGVLSLTSDDGSDIYYCDEEGVEHRYLEPLQTRSPHKYRFFSRRGTGRSPYVAHASYYRTITPELQITSTMGESRRLPYTKASTYRGMSRTLRGCRTGDVITYRFSAPLHCREIFLQTGYRQLPKTIITTGYVEVSYDGVHFERCGELEAGSVTLRLQRPFRCLRIVSTSDGNGTPYVHIQPPQIKPLL